MARRKPVLAATDNKLRPEVLKTILDSSGTTPLHVMTNTMQMLYNSAQAALREWEAAPAGAEREYLLDVARKHSLDACALAKEIAPYMHRKMPLAIETKDVTDEETKAMASTVREVERVLSEHQRIKRLDQTKH